MLISMLKSKIHMARITTAEINYVGSIAIDPKLLKAAGISVFEKVHVLNFENGNRFETYAIKGQPGEIGLRGPAARLGKPGERVIILSYGITDQKKPIKPKIVFVDQKNRAK